MQIAYKVDFINQSQTLHPFIETPPYEGFPADYLNDDLSNEGLRQIIAFLKKYSAAEGEEALLCLAAWVFNEPSIEAIPPFLLQQYPELCFGILIKSCSDYDNLQIIYDLASNELLFFDGLQAADEGKITESNPLQKVNLEHWLYLWDWWQDKKDKGLNLETGLVNIPDALISKPKYSIYKPLALYLEKDIPNWQQHPNSEIKAIAADLKKYMGQIKNKINPELAKIANLQKIAAIRPLKDKEQLGLDFLIKIQNADSVIELDAVASDVKLEVADVEVQQFLLNCINNKKLFIS